MFSFTKICVLIKNAYVENPEEELDLVTQVIQTLILYLSTITLIEFFTKLQRAVTATPNSNCLDFYALLPPKSTKCCGNIYFIQS